MLAGVIEFTSSQCSRMYKEGCQTAKVSLLIPCQYDQLHSGVITLSIPFKHKRKVAFEVFWDWKAKRDGKITINLDTPIVLLLVLATSAPSLAG